MIHRAFEARMAGDAVVAGSVDRIPGGYLLRTPEFPNAYDINSVVLEPGGDPALGIEIAERELDGLPARRVQAWAPPGPVEAPEGWEAEDNIIMAWSGDPPAWPEGVEEIEGSELRRLRLAMWAQVAPQHAEELADMQERQAETARTIALRGEDGTPVAWAQVCQGAIDDVWVEERLRGRGLGRTITLAAVAAGGWFLACDAADPRPQGLYRSLGFTEVGRLALLLRKVG